MVEYGRYVVKKVGAEWIAKPKVQGLLVNKVWQSYTFPRKGTYAAVGLESLYKKMQDDGAEACTRRRGEWVVHVAK
jgi:hypothetical protein